MKNLYVSILIFFKFLITLHVKFTTCRIMTNNRTRRHLKDII